MQDKNGLNRTSGSAMSSPYLNFDPAILNPLNSSQFIVPEGQNETRGKMDMFFFTIGASLSAGGLFGGINGLLHGIKETKGQPKNIRYTQIVNFVGKRASVSAQTVGAFALIYSLYDVLITNTRGVDDEFNTVTSAILTGVTYRSPHGLKSMGKGGAIGLGLSLAYLAFNNKDMLLANISKQS